MAFPFVFESNFEAGSNAEWDSESDTGGLLDFPHYSELARIPNMGMPFRGAYCMRIEPGDTNDHTLTEGDINISAGGAGFQRFYIWHDLKATADDIFNIFELQATGTVEVAVSLQITAATGVVEIGIGETEASTFNAVLLPRQWYAVELESTVDSGGGNDGTSTLYLDGASIQTISSLDQGAVTDGVLGTQGTLATTTGTLLFDEFVADDARIYPITERWVDEILMTTSGHVALGPCKISNVSLLSGAGTDNVLTIYDTDTADTTDASNIVTELKNTANNELVDPAGMPVSLTRGAYISLSGTDPRALVQLAHATGYGSEGAVRGYGLRRS